MKRKRTYIFIILLITVFTFSVAAICNKCATDSSTTTVKVGVADITKQTIIETTADAAETNSAPAIDDKLTYKNTQYGFSFSLPYSWKGYSIVTGEWEGNPAGSDNVTEKGPIISIRNPKWTQENPYQDIPIMVFTLSQWDSMQQEEFHIGAAPIGPTELGRNEEYVLALPARYNFSFPTGFEEVEKILEGNPLKAF
jgi:hypothetical protein